MSDVPEPSWDDIIIVKATAEHEANWLLYIWSHYCAERGLPDGTSEERPLFNDRAPHFIKALRSAHDRFTEGNLLALLDAAQICRDEAIPVPNWVICGLEQFMVDTIIKGAPGRRGRSNNPLARARQTVKQQKQRAVISGIRQAQRYGFDLETGEPSEFFLFVTLPNEAKAYIEQHGTDALGTNLQDAVELAEKCLRGTEFQATFSTLERLAKSTQDETFTVEEESVRATLGITALDEPPAPFGEFGLTPSEGCSSKAGTFGGGETQKVKKNDVFWLAFRRRDVRPSS